MLKTINPLTDLNGKNGVPANKTIKNRTAQQWITFLQARDHIFAEYEATHDRDDTFVAENYAELKEAGMLTALIPTELGGGGLSYDAVCDILATLGEEYEVYQQRVPKILPNLRQKESKEAITI